MKVKHLDWDSELFGYPVGKVEASVADWSDEGLIGEAKKHRLVYVFSDEPLTSNKLIGGDTKCTFLKSVEPTAVHPDIVSASSENAATFQELGRQSGIYSRYALDSNFQNNEFEKLYEIWVRRSLSHEISHNVLTTIVEGIPVGMITVGDNSPSESSIGLFAVSSEYRGQGIGAKLIAAAENAAYERGHKELSVATQGANLGARKLYEKMGFKLVSEKFIYHYWNDDHTVQ